MSQIDSKFYLARLDEVPNVSDLITDYNPKEGYSSHFIKECADFHHNLSTHRVHLLISRLENEIVGFFSIYVSKFDAYYNQEKLTFPILEVGFFSISQKYYSSNYIKNTAKIFLKKIELIAKKISVNAGCCFILAYVPMAIQSTSETGDESMIIPHLDDLLTVAGYKNGKGKSIELKKMSRTLKKHKMKKTYYFKRIKVES